MFCGIIGGYVTAAHSASVREGFRISSCPWVARRDVIDRAKFNLAQSLEVVFDSCEPQGPVEVTATYDEFNLNLRVAYDGPPIELPDTRPTNDEIMDSEDGQRRLAGFMLRRYADRVAAAHRNGRSTILFHCDY